MVRLKRLVLDILKPHDPNALEFSRRLAEQSACRVALKVVENDDMTQTVQVVIEGPDIDFESVRAAISEFGASLHSIDEVEVEGVAEQDG